TMIPLRDRLLRRLMAEDRQGRLLACYPVAPDHPGQSVNLHSKLIIVDGRFLRIGSSNLNNRSLGMDTECDIAVEAADALDQRIITRFRDQLLAEHLAADLVTVEAALRHAGGALLPAVRSLLQTRGGLHPFALEPGLAENPAPAAMALFDPAEPFDLGLSWR
ncbi:MAG: phospholipase, partial [Rhodospirillales bacterium]|nr:phospholipase [Rhodospirillales bacterium]